MKTLKQGTGLHIGFTGIDGAGKSTQAIQLCSWLKLHEVNAIVYEERRNFVSEVTDTLAKKRGMHSGRNLLGEGQYVTCISFEVLRQVVLNIKPYTSSGITIVTSRTINDWIAGAMARDCPSKEFLLAKEVMLFGGMPDITIWLDTNPEIAQRRIDDRGFDSAKLTFLRKYRLAFQKLSESNTWHLVNGDSNIETVHQSVTMLVQKLLS